MILQATIPPRSEPDLEQWLVEQDFDWRGETTGSTIGLDAARFASQLSIYLNTELQNAEASRGDEGREKVCREPLFRNQAVLTLWLAKQIGEGKDTVDLTDFPCVSEYPGHLNDLIFKTPAGGSPRMWFTCLASAWCPRCEITYGVADLREVVYELLHFGVYVLTCPRDHPLFVVGEEMYVGA